MCIKWAVKLKLQKGQRLALALAQARPYFQLAQTPECAIVTLILASRRQ